MRESVNGFRKLGNDLVGVEIGVWRGESALGILQNLPIKKLYLVDPYIKYDGYNISEISGHPHMEENEAIAREVLGDYDDKIVWIKKKAHDALVDIPDDVDFVYIDGNHNSVYVRQDIEDYYPKVREGGILAGHDFQKAEIAREVMKFNKDKNHDLWTFPFKEANFMHDWVKEWKVYTVPSHRISVDQEDWWLEK